MHLHNWEIAVFNCIPSFWIILSGFAWKWQGWRWFLNQDNTNNALFWLQRNWDNYFQAVHEVCDWSRSLSDFKNPLFYLLRRSLLELRDASSIRTFVKNTVSFGVGGVAPSVSPLNLFLIKAFRVCCLTHSYKSLKNKKDVSLTLIWLTFLAPIESNLFYSAGLCKIFN